MTKFRDLIQGFVTITTGIVFLCALSATLSGEETIPTAILWQAMLAGGLCSLATVLLFPSDPKSRRHVVVGISLHFLSLCAIMLYCGTSFGWIDWTLTDAAYMIGCVVLVYAFTTGVSYLIESAQARMMDRLLKEKYPGE